MNFIKKFILEKLVFKEPKDIAKDNSLDRFVNTLTQEEKDAPFMSLSDLQKVQYTQAITDFQIETMGNLGEAVTKSLAMFAIKLHKQNINSFSFEQSFYGTKEDLKEELFSIQFIKTNKISKTEQMVEYADKTSHLPRKKSENFLQQSDVILQLVENLYGKFDMNSSNELPLRASCILMVAEFMSQCNMETLDITLEGLMEGDKDLNTSYQVKCFRKEFLLNPENYIKKKLF